MVEQAFRILSDRGYGRLVIWLALSGQLPPEVPNWVRDIASMAHARRRAPPGAKRPRFEDTLFRTMLIGFVIFGESSIGDLIRRSAGVANAPRVAERFRVWLAGLLEV
jgi:hypothetical protein